ncbi:MAG: hypothetical protein A4S16_09735 [Proteobacteria bacterium SG_bin6]|nr:MAG: hypothetical protein A4S16_09735 [Proteobacteria bacterium SG_bin6]
MEFGLIAPAFVLMLLGAFDLGHDLYMRAVLQGILQKAARDSTLESAQDAGAAASIDTKVRNQVQALAVDATVNFSRRYYRTFSQAAAARAESWTDTDGDGRCDNGEPYTDANNNSVWDADGGDSGQGGAKDKVVYTATVRYAPLIPMWRLFGLSNGDAKVLTATTVLANQPYGDQGSYGAPVVRNCP